MEIAAASEPAFGSLNSWHHRISPSRLGRTQRATWSGRAVLHERQQHPRADAELGLLDAGELLVDHELLDGSGAAAPRLGPVRNEVAGVDERRHDARRAGSAS